MTDNQLSRHCPFCKAKPGEPCIITTYPGKGELTPKPHRKR